MIFCLSPAHPKGCDDSRTFDVGAVGRGSLQSIPFMSSPSHQVNVNAVTVTQTQLAASLWSLGFPFKGDLVQPDRPNQRLHTQFIFWGPSVRPEFAHLNLAQIINDWEEGKLDREEPLHPLAIRMRAQHNYNAVLKMIHESRSYRLCSVGGGRLFVYREGQETASMMGSKSLGLTDLPLIAALGLIGLPVVKVVGSPGHSHFYLPLKGYQRLLPTGERVQEDLKEITCLAPTAAEPFRLRLEDIDPLHPLIQGVEALNFRIDLKKRLESRAPARLMEDPEGGPRQAMLSINASGRVMAEVGKHFRAPPVRR